MIKKKSPPKKKATKKTTRRVKETPEDGFKKILALLNNKFGTDLTAYKPTTIKRRVQRQMMLENFSDPGSYAKHLRKSSNALKKLHQSIFIHVTEFFRDPEAFHALKQSVLKSLMSSKNNGDCVRAWVAGCSTGEEAYSIAMAFTEAMTAKKLDLKLQLFATDISEEAIQKARRGVYPEEQLKGMDKKDWPGSLKKPKMEERSKKKSVICVYFPVMTLR